MYHCRVLQLLVWLTLAGSGCAADSDAPDSQLTAAGAAGASSGPCPALPLSELCGGKGEQADPERNWRATCPKNEASVDPCTFGGLSAENACGGHSVELDVYYEGLRRGTTQYHFDAQGKLVGAHWRDFREAAGCAVDQTYGMACTLLRAPWNNCPIATGQGSVGR